MVGREGLLDAAFETLAREWPLRPEHVAREAGASKALVFHHFRSREGLLDAMAARVLAQTQEGLARLVADYPNPRERLAALARALLGEPMERGDAQRRVLHFWLSEDAAGRPRWALRDALLVDFVAATVREGVATGALRAGADAGAIARDLLARWHGATLLHATGQPVDFEVEAERAVEELARRSYPA